MNIEILAKQAIDRIKSEYVLPERGFLAGGSIANIIWEIASGNKAVINDIDIFLFNDFKSVNNTDDDNIYKYTEEENEFYEYSGCNLLRTKTKDFYEILESNRNGILNIIKYNSNTTDPNLILNSFDINATKVGYLIEEDKIFYSSDFVEFLNTGDLKISNIRTPAHTAIRLCKKKHELKCKLNDFEYKLIHYVLSRGFSDTIKLKFRKRYQEMYSRYDELTSQFKISRDTETEKWIKSRSGEDIELYYLNSAIVTTHLDFNSQLSIYFNDNNLNSIYKGSDFLFYIRNIHGNKELSDIWSKLSVFFNDVDYIDREVTLEDIELLGRLIKYAPNSIKNLYGYKLSEQIDIINKIFDNYKEDPLVAISILEKMKIDKNIELDDNTSLLLELSVRREIVNDNNNKVKRIVDNIQPTKDEFEWI